MQINDFSQMVTSLNLPTKYIQQCFENSRNQDGKSSSELLTWVVLLDPADAVLVNLFGFLRQHSVLQVYSVEAHVKPENM